MGIQTEHLDRGPSKAVTFCRGNIVVAVMHDVLTNAEKVLAQNGSRADVSAARELFQQEMRLISAAPWSG